MEVENKLILEVTSISNTTLNLLISVLHISCNLHGKMRFP